MTLYLTRDEAAALEAEGRVVLFREGSWCCFHYPPAHDRYVNEYGMSDSPRGESCICAPPAEFVEAAKPCEACLADGWWWCDIDSDEHIRQRCGSCVDGKRRITAVVPCYCVPIRAAGRDWPYGDCLVPEPCIDGLVTVATVVVEWGPLVVLSTDDEAPSDPCVYYSATSPVAPIWYMKATPDGWHIPLTLPPGVDPATLVGRYALGIRKVDQP